MLLVRVAERPRERRPGFTGLPRWDPAGGLTIDWVPDAELEPVDPRVVRRKADGLVRLTFISHLRVVRCGDGRAVREVTGVTFRPQAELEEFGVEDPRITPLDGRFYFTYVAVSRHGPATALASTADFRTFERHGVIFCPENKDVVLFPERIGGAYAALHRPVCGDPVHPAGDVGRAVAGPDPLGRARPARRLGRRVAIRPGRGRAAADPRPGRLAGDLPRQPPPDPARRGRGLLRRGAPPRPGRPGPGAAADRRSRSSCPRPTSRSPASCRTSSSRPAWCGTARRCSSTTAPPTRVTAVAEFSERDLLDAMTDRRTDRLTAGSWRSSTSSSGTVANVLA